MRKSCWMARLVMQRTHWGHMPLVSQLCCDACCTVVQLYYLLAITQLFLCVCVCVSFPFYLFTLLFTYLFHIHTILYSLQYDFLNLYSENRVLCSLNEPGALGANVKINYV